MNSSLKMILVFTLGAAAGAVVTWKVLDEKYKKLANEEIEEVRELYLEKRAELEREQSQDEPVEEEKTDAEIAETIIETNSYRNYSTIKEEKGGSEDMRIEPYVISPDEYGQEDDYDCESLVYYADGILADTWDNVIRDVDLKVGDDFATHFGEYEDDTVFIRNDSEKLDYEICRDERTYSEAVDPDLTDYE